MLYHPHGPRSWLGLLATLAALLLPAATLAEGPTIALSGDGGDAWTFEKGIEGVLPDGGCDEVLVASPTGMVQAWHADGRFGAVVPLQEGENEVRAICRAGGADRSVASRSRRTGGCAYAMHQRPGFGSSPPRTASC
jgi:hypothetical protein